MNEIIESHPLIFEKSCFIVDLIKHRNGRKYVEIIQTINNEKTKKQSIKLNPSALGDVIEVLDQLNKKIKSERKSSGKPFQVDQSKEIQKRYLTGVPIKELSMQFKVPQRLIEDVLVKSGIEIVSPKIPWYKKWRGKRR